MNPSIRTLLAALAMALLASLAFAQMGETVTVTFTNDSPQPISPPILMSHALAYQPVVPGDPAEPALWRLAEEGDASELATVARVASGVHEVVVADGPVPPGGSVTLEIGVTDDAHYLTLLGMLVATNDAFVFWGADAFADAMMSEMGMGMTPDIYDGVVRVFDAGSEADTESCEHIPGPRCGSAGVRVTDGAEGTIHLDGGILGVGDLDPAEFDWRNPAATVELHVGGGM